MNPREYFRLFFPGLLKAMDVVAALIGLAVLPFGWLAGVVMRGLWIGFQIGRERE